MSSSGQEKLRTACKLFSSAVVQELARRGYSPKFSAIARDSGLDRCVPRNQRVRDLFDFAFMSLRREGLRDEYVYRSALIQKQLLGRHSLRTATVLNEFRVGECKADVAILNGTSTVYEIKSERDSLARLEKQVDAYAGIFSRVFVVAADAHVEAVQEIVPAHVGIMLLNSRFCISVVRDAISRSECVSPLAIFDSVRTAEARMILSALGEQVPNVPNTELSSALRRRFERLNPAATHDAMVEVLKVTRAQSRMSELLLQLPRSLYPAALSIPIRRSDHARLISAVDTRLSQALSWG